MIPVIGLLLCGYIIVRMVEIIGRPDTRHLLAFLSIAVAIGAVAGIVYFCAVGGIVEALTSGADAPLVTDTTATPFTP